MKYRRKGSVAKSEQNEVLLVDENKKAYKTDESVAAIWSMCDGNKNKEQIVDMLAQNTKKEKTKIDKVVSELLVKLEQMGLLEKC